MPRALIDVRRMTQFLVPLAPEAAARVRNQLLTAPQRLLDNPRIGSRFDDYGDREVRKLPVGDYELRYEIRPGTIRILRIYHQRENR